MPPADLPNVTYENDARIVILIEDSDEYSGDEALTIEFEVESESEDGAVGGLQLHIPLHDPLPPISYPADSTTGPVDHLAVGAELRRRPPPLTPSPISNERPQTATASTSNIYRSDQACLPTSILEEIGCGPVPLDYRTNRDSQRQPKTEEYSESGRPSRETPLGYIVRETTTIERSSFYPTERSLGPMPFVSDDPFHAGYGHVCDCCFRNHSAPQQIYHLLMNPTNQDANQGYYNNPPPIWRHKVRYWYPTTYSQGTNGFVPNGYTYVGCQFREHHGYNTPTQPYYTPSNPYYTYYGPTIQDYHFPGTRLDISVQTDNLGPYWEENIALPARFPPRAASSPPAAHNAHSFIIPEAHSGPARVPDRSRGFNYPCRHPPTSSFPNGHY